MPTDGYQHTYFIINAYMNKLPSCAVLTKVEISQAIKENKLSEYAIVEDENGKLFSVRRFGEWIKLIEC